MFPWMVNRGSCKSGLWDQSGLVNCQCLHFINVVLFEWSEKLDHVFQSATTLSVLSEALVRFRQAPPVSLSLRLSSFLNALSSCRSSIFILILPLLPPDEPHLDREIKASINLWTSFTHQIAALSLFHYFWKAHRLNNCSSAYYYCSYYNSVRLKENGSSEEVTRRVIGQ